MRLRILTLLCMTTMLVGCQPTSTKREKEAQEAVDSFATYYFNWRFDKAQRFVTDSSQVWLRYAASQVSEEDIAALREKEYAVITLDELSIDDTSSPSARITVEHFLRMDSIGTVAHEVDKATFCLLLEESDTLKGRWRIRMAGLPQSEKQNRD